MSRLTLLPLPTLAALRAEADRWDDLWVRSGVSHPTSRAALIADWIECFSDADRFRGLVVCQGDRFVAALPLVVRRKGRLVTCVDLPGNEWASAGQLLVDPSCDVGAACDRLLDATAWPDCETAWFASLPLDAPWWRALAEAGRRSGRRVEVRRRYQVGRLDIGRDWRQQQSTWSKGLRSQIRGALRRLEQSGPLTLRCESPRDETEVDRHLQQGLQLEQAGWKGRGASSILSHDTARRYVHRQASRLAGWGQLHLSFLEQNDKLLAFEYGWLAKNVYHSYKVAYDERFQRYSPGQLLVYLMLERFTTETEVSAIDFLGPLDQAVARWRPETYSMGRLLIVPASPKGHAIAFASTVATCWRQALSPSAGL